MEKNLSNLGLTHSFAKLYFTFIFLLSISCSSWNSENLELTRKNGDIIIIALEKYKSNNKEYPKDIKDLIPRYLERLPKPQISNNKWIYSLEKEGFFLGVTENNESEYPLFYYSYKNKKWYADK